MLVVALFVTQRVMYLLAQSYTSVCETSGDM